MRDGVVFNAVPHRCFSMRELLIEESIASATESVILRGDGIAAACAGRLLIDAKMNCALIAAERPKLAAILLGEPTQRL